MYMLIHVCKYIVYVCVIHVPMCVRIYMWKYVCISVHTCDHFHLVLLQILENYFVGFHLVQKLLQHFHTYSNINTLICDWACKSWPSECKNGWFLVFLLYHNLITICNKIWSLLQNLMGFLWQLMEMQYYILNGIY